MKTFQPLMEVRMMMMNEGGEWRVSAPNGHYRECFTADLSETVEKVCKDYADWLKNRVDLDYFRKRKVNEAARILTKKLQEFTEQQSKTFEESIQNFEAQASDPLKTDRQPLL